MSDDPKPVDPMEAVLERRRKLVAEADRFLKPFERGRYRRGDIEARANRRKRR